jgi:hypothetical protein
MPTQTNLRWRNDDTYIRHLSGVIGLLSISKRMYVFQLLPFRIPDFAFIIWKLNEEGFRRKAINRRLTLHSLFHLSTKLVSPFHLNRRKERLLERLASQENGLENRRWPWRGKQSPIASHCHWLAHC